MSCDELIFQFAVNSHMNIQLVSLVAEQYQLFISCFQDS